MRASPAGLSADTIVREFVVPEGKYFLVPMLVAQADNIDTEPPFPTGELRDLLRDFVNDPMELHASIDGVDVPDLVLHRAESPVFSFEFTDPDNFKSFNQGHPIIGLIDPILSDGYWLMLEPLPPGQHLLRYGGTWQLPFFHPNDVIVHMTVVPVPPAEKVHQLIAAVEGSGLPSGRLQALKSTLQAAQASFERDNAKAGANQLRAFQNKVRAQVARANPALAGELIEAAQAIINRAGQP